MSAVKGCVWGRENPDHQIAGRSFGNSCSGVWLPITGPVYGTPHGNRQLPLKWNLSSSFAMVTWRCGEREKAALSQYILQPRAFGTGCSDYRKDGLSEDPSAHRDAFQMPEVEARDCSQAIEFERWDSLCPRWIYKEQAGTERCVLFSWCQVWLPPAPPEGPWCGSSNLRASFSGKRETIEQPGSRIKWQL